MGGKKRSFHFKFHIHIHPNKAPHFLIEYKLHLVTRLDSLLNDIKIFKKRFIQNCVNTLISARSFYSDKHSCSQGNFHIILLSDEFICVLGKNFG